MELANILTQENVVLSEIKCKKKALELISQILTKSVENDNISTQEIFEALIVREKKGSTLIGRGVAIPHACLDIKSPIAAFIKFDTPFSFDQQKLLIKDTDNKEHSDKFVDLVFAFIIPKTDSSELHEEYEQFLQEVADKLKQIAKPLRKIDDVHIIYQAIIT